MSDPITAAAIGAGISGGTSLLQGKKLSTSLRDAAIGGALGGAGGYLGGAMGGAGGSKVLNQGIVPGPIPSVPTTFMNENIPAFMTSEAGRNAAAFNPSSYAMQTYSDGVLNQYAPNFADIVKGKSADFTGGGYGPGFFENLGSSAMDAVKANPFQAGTLGLNLYDRMTPSQAPLQPSPMLNAQQLMGQQGPVPTPQFNSLLQASRRPILIG
jgi:hypothetical protein